MKRLLLLLVCACLVGCYIPARAQSCVAIDAEKLKQPMAGRVLFLWGQRAKFWPQGTTLRVRFLDGPRSDRDRAWSRFQKIDELVNIAFVRVPAGASDIRVSFAYQGHWAYMGKDAMTIPQNEPTMNLSLSRWDSIAEWDRVVIHELLHSLGFGHELQHPHASIPWNVPVVLSYYRQTQGWSDAQTRRQVLTRESSEDFSGTVFDKDSIMAYPVPRAHVTDPAFAIGWNKRLSLMDIARLRETYP